MNTSEDSPPMPEGTIPTPFQILNWGLIDYEESLTKQLELVSEVFQKQIPGYIIFCSHPPIVTLGRKTEDGDVFAWDGAICKISRGGRATYHGPSQLVVYPIVNLENSSANRPHHDIGKFLRNFETAIVEALSELGLEAQGKSLQKKNPSVETPAEETGVWVGSKKLASLGLAVKNWVTYHGAAVNVEHDPKAFFGMKPCGFSSDVMTSIETLSGKKISHQELIDLLEPKLQRLL